MESSCARCSETFAALLRGGTFVPIDFEFFARGLRLPPGVGDDGDAAEQAENVRGAFDDRMRGGRRACL